MREVALQRSLFHPGGITDRTVLLRARRQRRGGRGGRHPTDMDRTNVQWLSAIQETTLEIRSRARKGRE